MIKVGQIYRNKYFSNIKIVITQENLGGFNIIYTDGSVKKSVKVDYFDNGWIFEKEYPTWQEAVNSPEFKEESNE